MIKVFLPNPRNGFSYEKNFKGRKEAWRDIRKKNLGQICLCIL
jgi:hypothetical protein